MPSFTEKLRQIRYARMAAFSRASSSEVQIVSVWYSRLLTRTVQVYPWISVSVRGSVEVVVLGWDT